MICPNCAKEVERRHDHGIASLSGDSPWKCTPADWPTLLAAARQQLADLYRDAAAQAEKDAATIQALQEQNAILIEQAKAMEAQVAAMMVNCSACHRRPAKILCRNCGPVCHGCSEEWQCRRCGACCSDVVTAGIALRDAWKEIKKLNGELAEERAKTARLECLILIAPRHTHSQMLLGRAIGLKWAANRVTARARELAPRTSTGERGGKGRP